MIKKPTELCNREMSVPAALCQFGGPTISFCNLERGHDGICWAGTLEDYQKYLNKEYPWNQTTDSHVQTAEP